MGWARRQIAVSPNRTFKTPFEGPGQVIRSPAAVKLGGSEAVRQTNPIADSSPGFFAWYDRDLAAAWFAEARRLANDFVAIEALSPKFEGNSQAYNAWMFRRDPGDDINLGPQPLLNYGNYRQLRYAHKIVEALANGYNALNIPWYLHQPARELYWKWMAGPIRPDPSRVFGTDFSWGYGPSNTGWYVPGPDAGNTVFEDNLAYPILDDSGTRGLIPSLARSIFKQRLPDKNKFIQTIGIGLSTDVASQSQRDERSRLLVINPNYDYYAPTRYNAPFVMSFNSLLNNGQPQVPFCDPTRRRPLSPPLNCDFYLPTDGWVMPVGASAALTADRKLITLGSDVLGNNQTAFKLQDDWRSFRGDFPLALAGTDPKMRVSLGPAHYLAWLREWAALTAVSPEEIITSAREFSIYWNYQTVTTINASSEFQRILQEATAIDRNITIASGLISAIGGALAGVTYGVSAVAGAALAAGLNIFAAMPNAGKITNARDDLGRFKPVIEKAWLAGEPGREDGMPVSLAESVPLPSGYRPPVELQFFMPNLVNQPPIPSSVPLNFNVPAFLSAMGLTCATWHQSPSDNKLAYMMEFRQTSNQSKLVEYVRLADAYCSARVEIPREITQNQPSQAGRIVVGLVIGTAIAYAAYRIIGSRSAGTTKSRTTRRRSR